MATVNLRIKTIKSYTNYAGMEVSAKEIEDAVLVTISYYRIHNNRAYENTEFWVVPNATLENSDYLNKEAYQVYTSVTRNVIRTFITFRRRWRRW